MTDAIVSAVVEQLITILLEGTRREVKLVTEVGKELKKLKSRLNSIQALLGDAEEKQIKEESIKLWLYKLKQACYDMEDVLDEWNTSSLMLQKEEANQKNFSRNFRGKVCLPFNPCFCLGQVLQHRATALKIKDISDRLNEIDEEKNKYGFASREITESRREESTCYTELSKLHGRDTDMKDLVSSLLCGSSDQGVSDAKTIFVVGMGGVGKTALAQLVFGDGEVMNRFEHRVWVCVSEVFDGKKVAKEIIVSLESLDHVSARDLDSVSLQILVDKICKSIQRKKVLLVLDDVWEDQSRSWESLNEAFKHAAPESRILVTTRKETVVGTMKSFGVFNLKQLNEEDCWKILSQEAFVRRTEEQCKSLEDIGRKIAEKCRGLPLAAKALGSMLRFRETREEWENILNSEVWNLGLGEVFAALLLSYYDLPSTEKQCFLYCSVFPKDFEIKRDDLIHQWIAEGYLSSSETLGIEIIGVGCFQCLVARSFFQDLEKHEDGSITCKIHDIVVDFARHLIGKELEFKELHTADNLAVQLSPEETRHLSVTLADRTRFPTTILGAAKLRSLNIFKVDDEEEEETGQYLCNLFIQAKHLRLLNFHGGTGSIVEFPKEIGKLVHLRLINLSDSKLKRLPEAICKLCNLQSLYLRRCYYLEKLPDKMEKLISLRYLDTTECCMTCYPKGIGRLTSLRDLRGIVVRCDRNDNEEFCLGDLENLDQLRVLMLIVVGDGIDANEASRAKLQSKTHLNDLEVGTWEDGGDGDAVIKALNPAARANARFVRKRIQLLNKIRAHVQAVRARARQRSFAQGFASMVGENMLLFLKQAMLVRLQLLCLLLLLCLFDFVPYVFPLFLCWMTE